MTDYFLLLDEPRRPWLDPEALKQKFHARAAAVHPDHLPAAAAAAKVAAQQHYTALNAAYHCLREPKDRLRHLLELELGQKPSDLTNVPDDMLALFRAVGELFRGTDAFLAEKARATSPLVQVQLFERGQEWVEKLGDLRQQIIARRDPLLEELQTLNAAWVEDRRWKLEDGKTRDPQLLTRLLEIWPLLGFYERWLAQIQERSVQLSF